MTKNTDINMVEMFCTDFKNEIHNGNMITYIEDIINNPDRYDEYCLYCIDEYLESWKSCVVKSALYNIIDKHIRNSFYSVWKDAHADMLS